MPLISSYTDRWGKTHPEAWSYVAHFSADFEGKIAALQVWVYTSKTDAYSGKPPLDKYTIDLTKDGTPAVMTSAVLISPGVPAVYGEPDPETEVAELISPTVDPIYSEPTVVRPAIPSFGEVLAANATAYGSLEASLAGLAVQVLPELQGATWEPVDPVA